MRAQRTTGNGGGAPPDTTTVAGANPLSGAAAAAEHGATDAAPVAAGDHAPRRRARPLFDALEIGDDETIEVTALTDALRAAGLRLDDPRLAETMALLESVEDRAAGRRRLDRDRFARVVRPNALMITRALQRDVVIPEFERFEAGLERIFAATRSNTAGAVADYIPQLARVDPDQYGVAACTTDGQRLAFGDASTPFSVQSVSKPVNYSLALEEAGERTVHEHIGREPSGQSFNELTLNRHGRPHNPMINSGAIMSTALIRPQAEMADRFDHVMNMWQRLSGGHRPGFSNATYLSERRTADRNFALGYFMRENAAFPEGTDLVETLEFYLQSCSIELTADALSVVAATLANGGICPLTGERVLEHDTVQKCLSLMYSCGMYDFSGEWAFAIGLPAKSGVSGAIMTVVPNVMGLATWSPRIDENGNSVRGIEFSRGLVAEYNFHNYDNIAGGHHDKIDPRRGGEIARRNLLVELCWAASEGDVTGIRRFVLQGVDLNDADYDGRTALHLAASEGQAAVVEYFLSQGAELGPVDRWGHTPLDDARRAGHADVARVLEEAIGQ